ncbi:hypothetical protein BOTBODRAFT_26299 [Botryobasidium botryosum FD-172 SS1]|uniref:F-box domain-containing protein n=1 Tax=Botryobasidium botryosum (strain FD-172 SS1) TaxID=930990 RepID=A0A067NDQ5_BOTB1|nr:hypothetical protein BOTBODRAFT_26299 [Botryobasidium botryosum FD-172 SS1]
MEEATTTTAVEDITPVAVNLARRLPPELLSDVFLAVPSGTSYTFRPIVPIRISSVCRYWRDIALNTGALWSTITFFDTPSFHIAELFLSRSPNCALDVVLFGGWNDGAWPMTKAADIVLPALSRWRTLTVDFRNMVEVLTTVSIISYQYCQLEPAMRPHLQDLTFASVGPSMCAIIQVQSCVDALKPDSLSFCGVLPHRAISFDRHIRHLSLQCLTNGAGRPRMGHLQDILQSCTRLESLTLSHVLRSGGSWRAERVVLPVLKEFTLRGGSSTCAACILRAVDAPSLYSFAIRMHIRGIEDPLQSFLERHGSSIRELRISRIYLDTADCFQALPNLDVFGLVGSSSAASSLGRMVSYLTKPNAAPLRFSTIEIAATAIGTQGVESLKTLVEQIPIRSLSVRVRSRYAESKVRRSDEDWFRARVEVKAWVFRCEETDPRARCFEKFVPGVHSPYSLPSTAAT